MFLNLYTTEISDINYVYDRSLYCPFDQVSVWPNTFWSSVRSAKCLLLGYWSILQFYVLYYTRQRCVGCVLYYSFMWVYYSVVSGVFYATVLCGYITALCRVCSILQFYVGILQRCVGRVLPVNYSIVLVAR